MCDTQTKAASNLALALWGKKREEEGFLRRRDPTPPVAWWYGDILETFPLIEEQQLRHNKILLQTASQFHPFLIWLGQIISVKQS